MPYRVTRCKQAKCGTSSTLVWDNVGLHVSSLSLLDESQAFRQAWLCCICTSQVAAFDVALLNRVGTLLQRHKRLMCQAGKKKHTHVFLFLTVNTRMWDKGPTCGAVQCKAGHLVTLLPYYRDSFQHEQAVAVVCGPKDARECH